MIKAAPGYMTRPLEAITMRNGDCKSYSIAKYAAARVAGFSADHVRLVTVHDRRHSFDHMVAAVYQNEGWLKEKRRAGASITTTSRLSCRNCGLRITIRLEPISKSFEEDDEAGKLDKAEEIVGVVLPANEDPSPRKRGRF